MDTGARSFGILVLFVVDHRTAMLTWLCQREQGKRPGSIVLY